MSAASRNTPVLLRVLFAVALVFTLVGLTEGAFIVYYTWVGNISELRPDLDVGIRSWTVHHAMRPGFTSPGLRINSMGLRSPEVAVPKPVGTFRILLLGDSFMLGFRAADEQVFARRLEAQLRTDYRRSSIEVVNAGVLSYCPLLEYLQYRHHLSALDPDLVVLNFDMSDVQDHMEYSRDTAWSESGVPLFVTEPSLRALSGSVMPVLLSWRWGALKLNAVRRRIESRLDGVPFTRDLDRYLWALDDGEPWEKQAREAMAPIGHLADLLRHEQIPLLLATYPQPWQTSVDATPNEPIRNQYGVGIDTVHLTDRPFRQLESFAAESGIPFLNATPAFREDADPASLFLAADFHFSSRGHELYATLLADFLAQQPIVSAALQ